MTDFEVRVQDDSEQLILLPMTPRTFNLPRDEPSPLALFTGQHCVVFSGFAGIFRGATRSVHVIDTDSGAAWGFSDDYVVYDGISFLVGPRWRHVAQVSATVSPSAILSRDADDVDHSMWELSECQWDVVDAGGGQRIQLSFDLLTQGDENGWDNFTYHVVATGDLTRMPTPDEISADI